MYVGNIKILGISGVYNSTAPQSSGKLGWQYSGQDSSCFYEFVISYSAMSACWKLFLRLRVIDLELTCVHRHLPTHLRIQGALRSPIALLGSDLQVRAIAGSMQ